MAIRFLLLRDDLLYSPLFVLKIKIVNITFSYFILNITSISKYSLCRYIPSKFTVKISSIVFCIQGCIMSTYTSSTIPKFYKSLTYIVTSINNNILNNYSIELINNEYLLWVCTIFSNNFNFTKLRKMTY